MRIFSPEDGFELGLQGMINEMVEACDFSTGDGRRGTGDVETEGLARDSSRLAQTLTAVENGRAVRVPVPAGSDDDPAPTPGGDGASDAAPPAPAHPNPSHGARRTSNAAGAPVVGITGTGGAGKSTLTDELVRRLLSDFPDLTLAVLSVDPTRARTGGALLGDRIRMNALYGAFAERVYMRSFATRQAHRAVSDALRASIAVCREAGFDLILIETAGIGQSDTEIAALADVTLYVMTHDFGAPTQLEKIGMLDAADLVALNKFEKRGSADALRDIRKQVQRNRAAFTVSPDTMPVYPTMASHFGDPGVSRLYLGLLDVLREKTRFDRTSHLYDAATLEAPDPARHTLIPPRRQRYLAEIAETDRGYRAWAEAQSHVCAQVGRGASAPGCRSKTGARTMPTPLPSAWARWRPTGGTSSTPAAAPSSTTGTHSRRSTAPTTTCTPCAARNSACRSTARPSRARACPASRSRAPTAPGRTAALCPPRKPARLLPLHGGPVPVQARGRGPDAHVRRRGKPGAHQPPLPPRQRRAARRAPLHRLRLGHPLRLRPRRAARHLRQGGQRGRVRAHARRR